MWTGNEPITIAPSARRKGRYKGRLSKPGFIAVVDIGKYLVDKNHPNHLGSAIRFGFIGKIQSIGALQAAAISVSAKVPGKPGAPKKNCGIHFESRTAAGTFMSEEEKNEYARRKIAQLGISTGMWAWHDHEDGSSDLHILALNIHISGRPLQAHNDPGIRRKHLAISDAIEADLQRARLARNLELQERNVSLLKQGKEPLKLLPLFVPMAERRGQISSEARNYLSKRIVRSATKHGLKEWDHIAANLALLLAERKITLQRRGKLKGKDYISVQLDLHFRSKRFYLAEVEADVMAILNDPVRLAEIIQEPESDSHGDQDQSPQKSDEPKI
jgi:hypothetical protein